jgi:hypothetical protein
MTKTNCPKSQWVEVFTGVTAASFNLGNNFPDSIQKMGYKITYGSSAPDADETAFNYYELDGSIDSVTYSFPIQFMNSVAANVYVMSVYSDGFITY